MHDLGEENTTTESESILHQPPRGAHPPILDHHRSEVLPTTRRDDHRQQRILHGDVSGPRDLSARSLHKHCLTLQIRLSDDCQNISDNIRLVASLLNHRLRVVGRRRNVASHNNYFDSNDRRINDHTR